MAKDAPNFCSEWVSVSVFTLIVPLKVPPPKFDKGFVIGGYFGTGTFECCGAMPKGQKCSKLLLLMGFNGGFHFDFPIKVPAHRLDKGSVIGEYFCIGTFECCGAMPSGQRCSKLLLWMGFNDGFHFDFPIESTSS